MLKIKNVKKKYGDFELDCSMEVKKGYITGIVGANGAGKSTIFKAILGLISIDDGEIEINLEDKFKTSVEKKQSIGVSFVDSGFSNVLNIKRIAVILDGMYENFDKREFLRRCEIANLPLNKKTKEFSTGMKAKLKVLIATSYDAKLLILDEPTSGLDVIAREELLDLMRDYMNRGDKSILISSHISTDLEGLCDDIYMIHEGKMIIHEETHNILDNYGILKVTDEQFEKIDKKYLLKIDKENFGYKCLTKEKQYYMENYKDIVIEKCSIDEVVKLIVRGE